jgi:hypothetical protein
MYLGYSKYINSKPKTFEELENIFNTEEIGVVKIKRYILGSH